jgi:hypothetical protein
MPAVVRLTLLAAQGGIPKGAFNSCIAETLRRTPQAKRATPRADSMVRSRVTVEKDRAL